MIGKDTTELVLKGCNVHWIRSYQRVAERVNSSVSEGNRTAVEAFCLITKHIMIVTETGKLLLIQHLSVPLSAEQITIMTGQVQETGWSGGQGQAIYKCLANPFAKMMALSTWNKAPRNIPME